MPMDSGMVPPGWTEKSLEAQYLPGKGASMRYGSRPPSPDTVAPRGTKAWRDAFNAQRTWMQHQMFAGASLNDLGFAPVRGKGLHAFTALREGDFSPFDSSWNRAARGSERGTYDPGTGAYTMSSPRAQWYGPGGDKSLLPGPGAPELPPPGAPPLPGPPGNPTFSIPTPGGTNPLYPRRRTLRTLG